VGTTNRSLIALQEHVFAKHEDVQFELDHLEEDSEEYALLEDTLDDLSLVYAELTEILDEMDTLLLAVADYNPHSGTVAATLFWC